MSVYGIKMMRLKFHISFLLFFSFFLASCGSNNHTSPLFDDDGDYDYLRFPIGPHLTVTPGETCQDPDRYRYPERIPYCNRDVDTSTKWEIIRDYDSRFGYEIESMNRSSFKIDHFIPLCMGGSNSRLNLWPQHRTIYRQTDPLEGPLCELMADGKLLQRTAIRMIYTAKTDLDTVPAIKAEVRRLQTCD